MIRQNIFLLIIPMFALLSFCNCERPNEKIPYFDNNFPPIRHNIGKAKPEKEMPSPYIEEIEKLIEETPWWGTRHTGDCGFGSSIGQNTFQEILKDAPISDLIPFLEHRALYVRGAVHDVLKNRADAEMDALEKEFEYASARIKLELLRYVKPDAAYDCKIKLLNEIIHNPRMSVFRNDIRYLNGYMGRDYTYHYLNETPADSPIDIIGFHVRVMESHFVSDRFHAITKLSSYKENAYRAIPALIAALKIPDTDIYYGSTDIPPGYPTFQEQAGKALAKIVSNNPETIKQLQKIRSDDRPDIRCYGAALLYKIGYRKREQVDFIINRLKNELKPETSGEYLIGIIGSLSIIEDGAKKAYPIITKLTQHEDSEVRGRALRLIKKVNGLNDLINVCKNNLEHENPDVRIDLIEHLGWDMKNSRVRKLMYSAFNDEDPDVIITACFELYSNNEPHDLIIPGFINAFEKGLTGSNASNALFTIELMGYEANSAVPVLLESMGNARSNRISSYVRTLGKIGCNDKLITNKLIELCESDNEEVREHALRELDRYKEYVRDDQL